MTEEKFAVEKRVSTRAIVGKVGSPDTLNNVTKPLRRPQHHPQRLQHPRQKKSRIPTPEFKCPLCSKILPTKKGMTLHCYLKHRFSILKGMFLNETTVGTTTRSSESRLGLPDSGPQRVKARVNSLHRSC